MGTKEMRNCKKKLGLGELIQTNDSPTSLRERRAYDPIGSFWEIRISFWYS